METNLEPGCGKSNTGLDNKPGYPTGNNSSRHREANTVIKLRKSLGEPIKIHVEPGDFWYRYCFVSPKTSLCGRIHEFVWVDGKTLDSQFFWVVTSGLSRKEKRIPTSTVWLRIDSRHRLFTIECSSSSSNKHAMLSNIVGIISGGASGLGAATATCLIRNGAKVIVADLEHQRDNFLRLATHACAIPEVSDIDPGKVLAFAPTDVTNTNDVTNALDMAEKHFGEPVNAAISCAGVAVAKKTLSKKRNTSTLSPHPLDDFQNTLNVNTVGSFNLARLAAARMAARDPDAKDLRGCIINTASVAAYDGQIGQVSYAASKGALVGMTLPMARDLAPFGIRVMTIAPGLFRTPLLEGLPETVQNELGQMVPCPSRLGDPDEFGQLVMSILTNPMLNGEVIRLDGALRMPP